jgi:tetratricopeptide (TPR) repeat protein
LSSLGEVYVRTNRPTEAQAAFDAAAQANPAQAAFYLRNETIFFFQVGNADAQLKAAEKAIAADPSVAVPYYFKGQALVSKATMDPATQKMVLTPGCADAYQKYLQLDPNGSYSADAKAILTSAGQQVAAK